MANKRTLIDQYHIDITSSSNLTDAEREQMEQTFMTSIKGFSKLLWMQFPSNIQKKIKIEITR